MPDQAPTFVAIDGEADSDGRYIIMCDSLGRTLTNLEGITTSQALPWLTDLRQLAPKAKPVCFGLNYDANQWVADLSEAELRRLASEGRCTHAQRYKLTWLPRKLFTVTDARTKTHVRVAEVFGFFQTTFVKALSAWGLQPSGELEEMKRRRGTFTQAQLDRIVAYCQSECRLLVGLMDRLAAACLEAGCMPARDWIGAGAIANRLLANNGVGEHHQHDSDTGPRELVERFTLGAYFGGRVEMLAQGVAPQAHTIDLKSAYPWAATFLPSLQGAQLYQVKRYDREAEHAVWNVRWRDQDHGGVCPFPVRLADFTIIYPQSGEGYYHAAEVRAALRCGYQLRIDGGVKLRVPRKLQPVPFAWIPSVFRIRDQYKRQGHAAEKALKLGLNSVYGKLAQGYGYGGELPPFQSYLWAGEITARTRAVMLHAAHAVREPLMISTDGLFSVDRMRNATPAWAAGGSGLGSLERGKMADPFIVQAGVYSQACQDCDGMGSLPTAGTAAADWQTCPACRGTGLLLKSRGFAARDVDYHALRDRWLTDGPDGVYHYTSRRFIGLRVALARNKLREIWRTWPDERRSITLTASRKITPDQAGPLIRLQPLPGPHVSLPYQPKADLYDDPTDDLLEMMQGDDQPDIGS